MLELITLIIFLIGLIGMAVIIFKKIPVLVELAPGPKKIKKPNYLSKLKNKISFSPELTLQRMLSKIRAFTFRTEKKLLKKALERKNKFSDDFWDKVRRGK